MSVHGAAIDKEPCPACGSRDNLARYEDGYGKCFGMGCEYYEMPAEDGAGVGEGSGPGVERAGSRPNLLRGEYERLGPRGIDEETCRKFRYLVATDENGRVCQVATYTDKAGRPVAQKVRYPDKTFRWAGEPSEKILYGQQLWKPGRRVVVTEGEIDALSVAQALNLRWPVVSIPDGAQSAKRALADQLEWLEGFDTIVLMFDQDDAGRAAAADAAELFTPGKCAIAALPRKDPNDMLVAGDTQQLVSAVWEAKPFRPDGIVDGRDLWSVVATAPAPGFEYPWPCLDALTYGMRERELVVWCAGTGIGKSSFVREVAYQLAMTHAQTVGIAALEEGTRSSALHQMGLHLGARLTLPAVFAEAPADARRAAFDDTLGTGRFHFYDHFGSVDADSLIPKLRYMVLGLGARWLVLDHLSIMVSGTATDGDERKRIDEIMTRLRQLAENLEVGIHVVSHLRKANGTPHEEGGRVTLADLRGSGAIAQLADIVIGVERNQQGAEAANRSTLRVLKNRYSGMTGVAGELLYNTESGRLTEAGAFTESAAMVDDERSDF